MKKIGLTFFVISPLLLTGCSFSQNGGMTRRADPSVDMTVREISTASNDVISMLDEARSAVVGISVDFGDGYAVGSGVAIGKDRLILTNNHVIADGEKITLYYADKTIGSATVLWQDPGIDLAVLKSSKQIPYLSTENLENISIGEDVYAIGTPLTLDFKHSVTKGIVSAKDRVLESEGQNGTIFLQGLIQHDASINPGNSGGPLINSFGKVIGLNTLKTSEGEGIGFAIPIRLGKIVAEKLSNNSSYKTPYMGVFALDSDIAQVYGTSVNDDGVYIVSSSGPAKSAGLKKGDVITSIDNQKIGNMLDFRAFLYSKDVGDVVSVTYLRNGVYQQVSLILQQKV